MKVLYFTKYTRRGASSRLRSYQYFPYLEKEGIEVQVSPLFSDNYLEHLYKKRPTFLEGIRGYVNRIFVLFSVFKYDKIFIEKELFPYFPSWFEQILSALNVKYIVDYDDAIFHNYDRHPNSIIKRFLGKKIDRVMRHSECVIAGNSYLASRARVAGAKNVSIIPTVIDLSRYAYTGVRTKNKNESIIIGWIGSPSTFKYVQQIAGVLKEITEKFNVEIHIVGAKADLGFEENVRYIPWSEETEVDVISNFDIGIMPLQDSVWEKGKCSYKLIQYMACGLPIVASPVGMNTEVVKPGENGFLATPNTAWKEALIFYKNNPIKRMEHGAKGYSLVKSNYTITSQMKKLLTLFND